MNENFGGPVKRWVKDGILYAENDLIVLTWAPTDDPEQVGKMGWYGPEQICVEFVIRYEFEDACRKVGP